MWNRFLIGLDFAMSGFIATTVARHLAYERYSMAALNGCAVVALVVIGFLRLEKLKEIK